MTKSKEDLARFRVLVVDDQAHVRTWVRSVLKTAGMTNITEAADGQEALAAVTRPGASFDLILCDLRMPKFDGIETIRALAALGIESGVAIMSVEGERIIETAAVLGEMQGLRMLGAVPKPLTSEKLAGLMLRLEQEASPRLSGAVAAPAEDIENAFARSELRLMYQPKVWIASAVVAGVEALVRWKHPQLGLFPPGAFVPQMEESDEHSASLNDFAVKEAIACAGRWRKAGKELKIAVNLSARAFDSLEFPERIEALCLAADVSSGSLMLEVTETQVARDAIRMMDVAARLRLKGFSLSVDDFGTGQSGLAQLRKMPFNEIKIDRQFIHGCSSSDSKRSVVEASLALARSLKMISVAEGIENQLDWDLLEELGCDVAQGYFVARPMSEEGLESWAEQWAQHHV